MNIQNDIIPTCLIHLGEQPPPAYYRHSLEQLRLFTRGRIILVTEYLDEWQLALLERLNVAHIKPSSLQPSASHVQFLSSQNLDKSFREGFWTYVVERFFVLEEIMELLDTDRILHLEGDNLIFHDVAELENLLKPAFSGIAVPFDHDQRAVAGIFFAFSKTSLAIFNKFIVNVYGSYRNLSINDMQLLGLFRAAYPTLIGSLPVIPSHYPGDCVNLKGEISQEEHLFSRLSDQIGVIFDANALGQYIDGIDPRNSDGKDTRGFINETAMHRFDFFEVQFEINQSTKLRYPFLVKGVYKTPIANLHIHSKNLGKFTSISPPSISSPERKTERHLDIPLWDLISSERIQELADVCLTDQFTYNFYSSVRLNPKIKTMVIDGPRANLAPTKLQFRSIDRARVLFVNTHLLSSFQEHILPHLTESFVLISHASDDVVDEKFLPLLSDIRLEQWYAQNVSISHPKLVPIPIGIANKQFAHGDLFALHQEMYARRRKTSLLFTCLSERTHPSRRDKIHALRNNGFDISSNTLSYAEYLKSLSESEFVASPRGNGLDCHRTWEALYIGAIPIVDNGVWLDHFADLNMLGVDNWLDVDKKFLTEKLLTPKASNLEKLRLSYWSNRIFQAKYS